MTTQMSFYIPTINNYDLIIDIKKFLLNIIKQLGQEIVMEFWKLPSCDLNHYFLKMSEGKRYYILEISIYI